MEKVAAVPERAGAEAAAAATVLHHDSGVRKQFNYVPVPRAEQLPDVLRLGGLLINECVDFIHTFKNLFRCIANPSAQFLRLLVITADVVSTCSTFS